MPILAALVLFVLAGCFANSFIRTVPQSLAILLVLVALVGLGGYDFCFGRRGIGSFLLAFYGLVAVAGLLSGLLLRIAVTSRMQDGAGLSPDTDGSD